MVAVSLLAFYGRGVGGWNRACYPHEWARRNYRVPYPLLPPRWASRSLMAITRDRRWWAVSVPLWCPPRPPVTAPGWPYRPAVPLCNSTTRAHARREPGIPSERLHTHSAAESGRTRSGGGGQCTICGARRAAAGSRVWQLRSAAHANARRRTDPAMGASSSGRRAIKRGGEKKGTTGYHLSNGTKGTGSQAHPASQMRGRTARVAIEGGARRRHYLVGGAAPYGGRPVMFHREGGRGGPLPHEATSIPRARAARTLPRAPFKERCGGSGPGHHRKGFPAATNASTPGGSHQLEGAAPEPTLSKFTGYTRLRYRIWAST